MDSSVQMRACRDRSLMSLPSQFTVTCYFPTFMYTGFMVLIDRVVFTFSALSNIIQYRTPPPPPRIRLLLLSVPFFFCHFLP